MSAGTALQLAFIGFLVLLRLFERALERSRTPLDPFDKITDWRLPMDRGRDRRDVIGKDLTSRDYDPVADEQLRRLQDRRRKIKPDSGERRRRSDHA
jgi:hypothetical protein